MNEGSDGEEKEKKVPLPEYMFSPLVFWIGFLETLVILASSLEVPESEFDDTLTLRLMPLNEDMTKAKSGLTLEIDDHSEPEWNPLCNGHC
jgi:hypothetical protein